MLCQRSSMWIYCQILWYLKCLNFPIFHSYRFGLLSWTTDTKQWDQNWRQIYGWRCGFFPVWPGLFPSGELSFQFQMVPFSSSIWLWLTVSISSGYWTLITWLICKSSNFMSSVCVLCFFFISDYSLSITDAVFGIYSWVLKWILLLP